MATKPLPNAQVVSETQKQRLRTITEGWEGLVTQELKAAGKRRMTIEEIRAAMRGAEK